jgi:MoaA/NifB/PqqE/SkfB family radical SAM enzyme
MGNLVGRANLGDLVHRGKAFCMAPWVNLSVAVGGAAAPCCEIKGKFGDTRSQDLNEIWRGQAFIRFRDLLLQDQKSTRCWKCYDIELAGGTSMRQAYNRDYGHLAAELVPASLPPIRMDIRFNNLCNFTCRMCWHGASSRWHADALKLGLRRGESALIRSFESFDVGIEFVMPLLETVEVIYWAGGEPLLQEEHYEILKRLSRMGRHNVALCYNTNLSEFELGEDSVLRLWKEFSNIEVEISIDGVGKRAEIIRNGLVWDRFEENLRRLRAEAPHARRRFGITVSVFNVAALAEIHEYLVASSGCGHDDFHIHVLQQWEGHCIKILPKAMKEEISTGLTRYAERLAKSNSSAAVIGELRHVVEFMNREDRSDLLPAFRESTLRVDQLRGQSTAVACPELAALLG